MYSTQCYPWFACAKHPGSLHFTRQSMNYVSMLCLQPVYNSTQTQINLNWLDFTQCKHKSNRTASLPMLPSRSVVLKSNWIELDWINSCEIRTTHVNVVPQIKPKSKWCDIVPLVLTYSCNEIESKQIDLVQFDALYLMVCSGPNYPEQEDKLRKLACVVYTSTHKLIIRALHIYTIRCLVTRLLWLENARRSQKGW